MGTVGDPDMSLPRRVKGSEGDGAIAKFFRSEVFGVEVKPALACGPSRQGIGYIEVVHLFRRRLQITDSPRIQLVAESAQGPTTQIARYLLQNHG